VLAQAVNNNANAAVPENLTEYFLLLNYAFFNKLIDCLGLEIFHF